MATDQEIIDYYADLLILQYLGKPKAYATIQAVVEGVVMNQLPTQVRDAFDPDTAVGVQLDLLGRYVGVTRNGSSLSGVPISLDDDDYRQLINMAIIQNTAGSSLFDIQALIAAFFAGQLFVFDFKNMQMSYFILSSIGSTELVEMFITQDLLPKPMGVQLASIVFLPSIDDLFGFRSYSAAGVNISPMNDYPAYNLTFPWLTYKDTIPI